MPTTKKEINLDSALVIAQRLQKRLAPFCEEDKCKIAGSIRRKKPYVGDIEIVCIPKHGKATPPGQMFPVEMNLVIHHIRSNNQEQVGARGYLIKKGGERYYQVLFCGMQCDIFMTNAQQWGRMLAMRTGPFSYSKKMAVRWVKMGYKGHEGELIEMNKDGYGNLTSSKRDEEGSLIKPEFPTEKSFFKFLSWDYTKPKNRK